MILAPAARIAPALRMPPALIAFFIFFQNLTHFVS